MKISRERVQECIRIVSGLYTIHLRELTVADLLAAIDERDELLAKILQEVEHPTEEYALDHLMAFVAEMLRGSKYERK